MSSSQQFLTLINTTTLNTLPCNGLKRSSRFKISLLHMKPRCYWIDPATTLQLITQNVQGIKHHANDDKLQSGIANLVEFQAGIACLTGMHIEWRNFSCRQGYKADFTKLYSASRHSFSSSSETSSTPHK
jgi:hypothetical protein